MPRKERHQLGSAGQNYTRTFRREVLGKPEVHDLIAKTILAPEQQCLVGQVFVFPDWTRNARQAKDVDEPPSVHHLQPLL